MLKLKDLAQQLGLSTATVSRALARNPVVGTDTTKRVLALAQQLDYQPNKLAANLRKGQSQTIGVIVPCLRNGFFAQVVHSIEATASKQGYQVLICQSDENQARERQLLDQLLHANVAGILVSVACTTQDFKQFDAAQRRGVPVVFFDRHPAGAAAGAVVIDDRLGGYQATRHLLEQGFRRIAHLAGAAHLHIYKQRQAGYEDALREAGQPIEPALILTSASSLDVAAGELACQQLLALPAPPDAIFAASDAAALGCLQVLLVQGYRVPEDIGIVGFSNEFFSAVTTPALSTVDQGCEQLGRVATNLLLETKQDALPSAASHIVLRPRLLARASSTRQAVPHLDGIGQ